MATPNTSAHVSGDAVDIGPSAAAAWLSAHGAAYGLCRIYGNEPWHYEFARRPPTEAARPMYADPTTIQGCSNDEHEHEQAAAAGRPGPGRRDRRRLWCERIVRHRHRRPRRDHRTGTGGKKDATDQDKAVKFAECIREHGVPHFPDPDAKGDFVFGIDVSPRCGRRPSTHARTCSRRAP